MRKKIKVLHIGWGFRPWRGGGLIEYAEDLMKEQAKHGYEVYYICSGRYYPFIRGPKLKIWERDGYKIFEVLNPPIYVGSDKGTLFDLENQAMEKIFIEVLERIKPDIIHIQELAGWPSSIVDIIAERKIPSVMTLQDYFPLCPTLKLFDYKLQNCLDYEDGKKCVLCCKDAPRTPQHLIENSILYHFYRLGIGKPVRWFYKEFLKGIWNKIKKKFKKQKMEDKKTLPLKRENTFSYNFSNLANYFKERRLKNIERLKKIDLLIAQSYKVEEIYKKYLGENVNIKTLHLTVKHLEEIHPKKIEKIEYPINFATLNGCASIPKGAFLVLEALKILHEKNLQKYFKFHVFGPILKGIQKELCSFENVKCYGPYNINQLNNLLEPIEVGIVPSIWEEAYGYVGVEFLAKGIPIIGNARGGIVDYTIENLTGWLNKEATSQGLASIMEKIIKKPEEIIKLNRKILQHRDKLIKTMEEHFYEMDEIYRKFTG
jgi:glycosyltransferase involved in cell wall biosynthesis